MPPPIAATAQADDTRVERVPDHVQAHLRSLEVGDQTSPGVGIPPALRARTEPAVARAMTPTLVSTAPPRGRPDTQRRLARGQTDADARITTTRPDPRTMRADLIGRAGALAQLRSAVARARALAQPQLVTIVGNQGTGKSRLLSEFVAELVGAEGEVSRSRVVAGRARQGDAPGGVIASLLRDRFGLDGLPEAHARTRLTASVRDVLGTEPGGELLHYLGSMVGLDFEASHLARALADDPRQRDDVARAVLRRILALDAAAVPLVLVIDDLHLASESAIATLGSLAASLPGVPLVLVAATRPELLGRGAGWPTEHQRIDLRNLDPDDAELMLRGLLEHCDGLTPALLDTAVQQTGGNPFFLEQLVRLLIERGAIDTRTPRWQIHAARALAVELPISVEEAIEARIAELERPERELLEQAAVFGNVFWLSAVVAMARLGTGPTIGAAASELVWGAAEPVRARLAATITDLAERDYLLVLDAGDSTFPGDLEIVFKHNLEREFVVRATEPERLARYHLFAAQWLEARIGARSDEQLEFLATLYERGGATEQAMRCHLDAARRARGRDALLDARLSYERALTLLPPIDAAGGDRDAPVRMEILHDLGDVLDKGGHRELAEARFHELLELAWRFDHHAKAGAAYTRLARLRRRAGRLGQALEYLHRAEALHDTARDDRGIAAVLDELGRVHALRGELDSAVEHHQQALAIRRTIGDPRSIALSLAHLGRAQLERGDAVAAAPALAEALAIRRTIGDRLGVAQSLADQADAALDSGDLEGAQRAANEAHAEADAIGNRGALVEALQRLGSVASAGGAHEEAIATFAEARALAEEIGDRGALAGLARRRAEALRAASQHDQAWGAAQEAVAVSESIGAKLATAIAHRIGGELAIVRGDHAGAERELTRAAEIVRAVAHPIELARTYRAMATLRERLGDVAGAAEWRARAQSALARRGSVS